MTGPETPTIVATPGERRLAIPSAPVASRVPGRPPRRRRDARLARMLSLVAVTVLGAVAIRLRVPVAPLEPVRLAPLVVRSPIRVEGVFVRAAREVLVRKRPGLFPMGSAVPVSVTAYCLRGLTRRDHEVREGIVATDPRMFPLAHYLEVFVGKKYWGRFLIDDTGGAIKGNKIDVWTPACADARAFGRHKGMAVFVPRPKDPKEKVALTGRFGGVPR